MLVLPLWCTGRAELSWILTHLPLDYTCSSVCWGSVTRGAFQRNPVPDSHLELERRSKGGFPEERMACIQLRSSPAAAHTPAHHQDVLEKVQVAEGALRPIPQGSGAHLLGDIRVEGRLLEKERSSDILKHEGSAGE